jgi:hypothetical protein
MMAVKADVSTSDASDGLHLTSPLLAELWQKGGLG